NHGETLPRQARPEGLAGHRAEPDRWPGPLRPVRIEPAKTTGGLPADSTERSTRMPEPPPVLGRDGGGCGHGSCRPPFEPGGRVDQLADGLLVEAEGHQRGGAVARQAEVMAAFGWQVLELLLGRRLAQPGSGLEGAFVGLVGVQPVVGLREADRALADAEQMRAFAFGPADGVPDPVQPEDAAPG